MTIQWSNGFEDLTNAFQITLDRIGFGGNHSPLGWEIDWTGTIPVGANGTPGLTRVDPGFRTGFAAQFGLPSDSSTFKTFMKRRISYGTTSSCLHFNRRSIGTSNRTAIGFFSATQNIYVRQNGTNFLQLYINNSLVQTGTIDVQTGSPWHNVEIYLDISAGTVNVFVEGLPELSGTIPVGFSPTEVRVFSDKTSGISSSNEISFDDIIYYVNLARIGPMKAYGYNKTGNITTTFNNGDGSGADTAINDYTVGAYRSSNVRGNTDLFNYNNILPAGVEFNSVIAVNHKVAAMESTFFGSDLERVLVSGGTTFAEKVNGLQPYFSNTFERVYMNNPQTSAPWTAAEARAIQTGYRVGQYGQLAFTTQPSATGTQNTNLAQQPVVQVQTAGGALDTTYNGPVYLYWEGNPIMRNRIVVNAVAGVATFSGVQFTLTGNVRLIAAAKGRTSARSNTITIS